VVPRYREVYPDLPFLRSRVQFLIVYGVTYVLLFSLMMTTYYL
jgi:hypothetical protein